MSISAYLTKGRMLMRIIESEDGWLKVEVLRDGVWCEGRIGMAGLRLSPSTRKLTLQEIRKLPD